MVKTYDSASFNLALHFLQDANLHDDRKSELADLLAKDIQQAIEDFFAQHNLP